MSKGQFIKSPARQSNRQFPLEFVFARRLEFGIGYRLASKNAEIANVVQDKGRRASRRWSLHTPEVGTLNVIENERRPPIIVRMFDLHSLHLKPADVANKKSMRGS